MNDRSSMKIERAIKEQPATKPMPEAAEFWSDFRARARLHPQQEYTRVHPRGWFLGWSAATACAILLLGVFLIGLPTSSVGSEGKAFDVMVDHSAVIIMNDEPEQGTILWIVDMEIGDTGSEG